MASVVALDPLLRAGKLWRGRPHSEPALGEPSGHAALDAALPLGGWPKAALSEILLSLDGLGELRLALPLLARLSAAGQDIALVGAPYAPFAVAWQAAGVDLARLHLISPETPRDRLWASEQCLRAGCLAAVLFWPPPVDDRALRRLQVAAESGGSLGLCFRDARAAAQASPAALRLLLEAAPARLRVLKCRGGLPASRPIPLSELTH